MKIKLIYKNWNSFFYIFFQINGSKPTFPNLKYKKIKWNIENTILLFNISHKLYEKRGGKCENFITITWVYPN